MPFHNIITTWLNKKAEIPHAHTTRREIFYLKFYFQNDMKILNQKINIYCTINLIKFFDQKTTINSNDWRFSCPRMSVCVCVFSLDSPLICGRSFPLFQSGEMENVSHSHPKIATNASVMYPRSLALNLNGLNDTWPNRCFGEVQVQ